MKENALDVMLRSYYVSWCEHALQPILTPEEFTQGLTEMGYITPEAKKRRSGLRLRPRGAVAAS